MASAVKRLLNQGKITPPYWLESNLHLEVIMGSRAYGCNDPEKSDYDIRGVFTPPKVMAFPATDGLVVGYDQIPECGHWNESHIKDQDGKREYDFDIHNITKFLYLAEANNPNQIDLLFAHESQIKHCTQVGRMLLDSRRLFLSKLCWKRFRGYASDQFHKLKEKQPEGKRKELVETFGYDVKFAYHCLRLLRECEMILTEGDLDLYRGNEEYKAIRKGEWPLEVLEREFYARREGIEKVYHQSALPEKPDHSKVRELLLQCLEHHYGSLSRVVMRPDAAYVALRDIDAVLMGTRHLFDSPQREPIVEDVEVRQS